MREKYLGEAMGYSCERIIVDAVDTDADETSHLPAADSFHAGAITWDFVTTRSAQLGRPHNVEGGFEAPLRIRYARPEEQLTEAVE